MRRRRAVALPPREIILARVDGKRLNVIARDRKSSESEGEQERDGRYGGQRRRPSPRRAPSVATEGPVFGHPLVPHRRPATLRLLAGRSHRRLAATLRNDTR